MARKTRRSGVRSNSARHRAAVEVAAWVVLLLGALFLVVWRQTRAIAFENELRAVRTELELTEARQVEFARQIQTLSTRARISRVAAGDLGMHVPSEAEIVFLPMPFSPLIGSGPGGR